APGCRDLPQSSNWELPRPEPTLPPPRRRLPPLPRPPRRLLPLRPRRPRLRLLPRLPLPQLPRLQPRRLPQPPHRLPLPPPPPPPPPPASPPAAPPPLTTPASAAAARGAAAPNVTSVSAVPATITASMPIPMPILAHNEMSPVGSVAVSGLLAQNTYGLGNCRA